MPDFRELFDNPEEGFRSMWAGIKSHMHTVMVARVTQASDGHTVQVQPTVQQAIKDPTLTKTSYVDYPVVPDTPVHFPGGNGMVLTHGLTIGDEVLTLFAENGIDAWHQNGGTAQPISDRTHSLSDGVTIPGIRSDPRRLQQVDARAAHLRSEDKLHVHEMHPDNGHRTFSADPSTAPASATFDPLTMASKFIDHAVQGAKGLIGRAVSGNVQHTHGVDHDQGAWMSAFTSAGSNFVRAHPVLGSILSALDGKHSVTAGLGGVAIQSATSISLACPPGGLGLPSGSIGSGSMAPGAASSNVGALGGDLSGTLPNSIVTSIAHLTGQDKALVQAASDSAAATAGVGIGAAYVNTAVKTGVGVLAVRLT